MLRNRLKNNKQMSQAWQSLQFKRYGIKKYISIQTNDIERLPNWNNENFKKTLRKMKGETA
jgi:hypothetical protein